jgi:endoglucanase
VPFPAPKVIPTLVNNYKGPNLSGGEFNSGPNRTLNYNYVFPTTDEIDYYAMKGFGIIRLPFDIARAYDHAYSPLNTTQMGYIKSTVDYCLTKGMRVLLDPHNFGTIYDNRTGERRFIGRDVEGTNLFADFWGRMGTLFKNYPNVIYGLMNEPHAVNASEWYSGAVPAIKAIRAASATQMIFIPGTFYSGAHAWNSSHNAAVWAGFKGDPLNNFAFEMHQYLDVDSSGTHKACHVNASHSLIGATEWLIANKFKGFLGEFGWSDDPTCDNESIAFIGYLSANPHAWLGWTWWCGGPWYPWSYMYRLDPLDFIEPYIEKPQMATLVAHI